MHRIAQGVLVTVVAVGLSTPITSTAAQNEPKTAKTFKGSIVVAYEPCTSPDTVTDAATQACSTPVRSDPACGFGTSNGLPKGKGQLLIKSKDLQGWLVKLKLLNVEDACDGQQMHFDVTYRSTGHNCGGSDCTAVNQTATIADCTVERGVCKINVPVTNLPPDIINSGGTELVDMYVRHGSLRAFDVGLLSDGTL
jgi:hypothetical protein